MDIAYLHLITNHIPIIGVPFAVALLAFGIWRNSDELKTASFLIFAFLGIATLGTFLLGQGGEDFVENLAGVSHDAIEDHEDFAKFALASVLITAILSLFALTRYKGFSFLKRRIKPVNDENSTESVSYFPAWISFGVLFLALISLAIVGYTGKLGGKIRHTEFYDGTVNNEENERNRRGADNETAAPNSDQDAEEKDRKSGKGRGRSGRN